jgi:hypothetical protein
MCKQGYIMNKNFLPTCKGCSLYHFEKNLPISLFSNIPAGQDNHLHEKGFSKTILGYISCSLHIMSLITIQL